jgi:hypothetical protein
MNEKTKKDYLARALHLLRENGNEVAFGWRLPNGEIYRIYVKQQEDTSVYWRSEESDWNLWYSGFRNMLKDDETYAEFMDEIALKALAWLGVIHTWEGAHKKIRLDKLARELRINRDSFNPLLFLPVVDNSKP